MSGTHGRRHYQIFVIQDAAEVGPKIHQWLKGYSQETDIAYFTEHRSEAKKFNTIPEVLDYYRQVYTKNPVRTDGKPNRPLTAYTIEVVNEGTEPLTLLMEK